MRGIKIICFIFHRTSYVFMTGSIYWRHFPESQTVKINDSLILRCEGESSEKLQYQW